MRSFWRSKLAVALAMGLSLASISADRARAQGQWIDRATRWVEQTGQTTVIHRRFCRHLDLHCSVFGVDAKFKAIKDGTGEHDFSVVLKRPRVVIFFFMDKSSNILFAMHADGSVYRVIHIDVVTQEHVVLPADADQDLFNRELALWQGQLPSDQ
jgi:hypothetical protein